MRAPVAIVGGGPSGLAAAIELASRGVAVDVFEERLPPTDLARALTASPRSKLLNVRTLEHFRRWRLAERLRAFAPLGAVPLDVTFVTALDGEEIHRFRRCFVDLTGVERSPEAPVMVPQPYVEAVLREAAASQPLIALHWGRRLTAIEQDGDGVDLTFAGDDGTRRVRAAYAIGADGARSTVRRSRAIRMHGRRGITRNVNVVFRAPRLGERIRVAPAVQYWIVAGGRARYLGPLDGGAIWWAIYPRADAFDPAATLRADLPLRADDELEILDVTPWEAHELIAERYRDGRIFLIGDAAHLHPPAGGHGLNMGIADAVDLGWKLAAVLAGWGGERLLNGYEAERRALHERVVRQAVRNWAPPADGETPTAERIVAEKLTEFNSLGLVLGYRYDGSPLIVADGTPVARDDVAAYAPSARPGALAPHVRFSDGGALFDRLGPWFTLLAFAPDAAPVSAAAAARGLPLTVLQIRDPAARALYAADFVLVRPDQHVAWRGGALRFEPDVIDVMRGAA